MALYELRTYTLYVGKMAEPTKDSRAVVRIRARCGPLLLRRLEITQIGRRLILLGRHQEPIPAQEIVFLADDNLGVVLGIVKLGPCRTKIRIVHVSFVHSPGLRQSMVNRRDFVMKDIRFCLVAVDALLEDRLIVDV